MYLGTHSLLFLDSCHYYLCERICFPEMHPSQNPLEKGFWGLLGFVFLAVMFYEEMITQNNKDNTQRIFLAVLMWNANLNMQFL